MRNVVLITVARRHISTNLVNLFACVEHSNTRLPQPQRFCGGLLVWRRCSLPADTQQLARSRHCDSRQVTHKRYTAVNVRWCQN